MKPADRRPAARDVERHDPLFAAAHRVDEFERRDAEVVLRFGFDVDLFERGDRAIARRPQHADVGWTVVQHADEILRLARGTHALAIGNPQPVGIVAFDPERRFQSRRCGGREGKRLAGAQCHLSRGGFAIRVDDQADVGASRRVDIAGVFFGARLESERGGIAILDIDARHTRRPHDGDIECVGGDRAGDDAILEALTERFERHAERAVRIDRHVGGDPLGAVGALQLCGNRRRVASQPRFDRE